MRAYNMKHKHITKIIYFCMQYLYFGRCLLSILISKVSVIFQSGKKFCSFIHQVNIKRIFYPPDKFFPESSTSSAYLINIAPGICIMSGMEFWMSLFYIDNAYIGRQSVINTIFYLQRHQIGFNFQVCHLP